MKDLIVSVADSYQEKVIEALLPRVPFCSNTRAFTYDIIRNICKDSGSYNASQELLRPYITFYDFSLIVFDYEGSGIEQTKTRVVAEAEVEHLLSINGWAHRNAAIIIEPELENWIWQNNHHVQTAIGWEQQESLYTWARRSGWIINHNTKPERPKESLEAALKISGTSKSSAVYKKIASNVSYKGCHDDSFLKLVSTLRTWFPIG